MYDLVCNKILLYKNILMPGWPTVYSSAAHKLETQYRIEIFGLFLYCIFGMLPMRSTTIKNPCMYRHTCLMF